MHATGHRPTGLHHSRLPSQVNHLRKGGSVFHLQKMLGHLTLEKTRVRE